MTIEKVSDSYFALSSKLQDCHTQGNTYEGVLENIKDAISLHEKDRIENGRIFLS